MLCLQEDQTHGVLFASDSEKAFDSISLRFIGNVLQFSNLDLQLFNDLTLFVRELLYLFLLMDSFLKFFFKKRL